MNGDRLLTEIERQRKYLAQLPPKYSFPLFNAKSALQSQRSSAYRNSAAAARELVDNAIEAQASKVHIIFETYQKDGKGKRLVKSIAFIDNGTGMANYVDEPSGEVRHMARYALTWGGGTHFEDPQFIGRFGFGLPNASINQAMRAELYTRTDAGNPFTKAVLDIEEYTDAYGVQSIPKAEQVGKLPSFVEQYLKHVAWDFDHGTVIVWKKLDRITYKTPAKLKEHLVDDFGVTYRYLLRDDFELTVQSTQVEPVDPLFLESGCRFVDLEEDEEEGAQLIEDILLPVALLENEQSDEVELKKITNPHELEVYREQGILKAQGAIRIRVGRLPVGFALGESKYKGTLQYKRFMIRKPRRGMSFVRANREIQTVDAFPKSDKDDASGLGNWPMIQTYAYHWGIEVRFQPELDAVFGITNDKQGVRPINEFWRLLADEKIDKLLQRENAWQEKQRKKPKPAEKPKDQQPSTEPTPAEQAARSADTALGGGEFLPPDTRKEEARTNLQEEAQQQAREQKTSVEDALAALEQNAQKKKYQIAYFDNPYGPAWEPEWLGRQVVVKINQAHPFYQQVYGKLLEAETQKGYRVKNGLDIVLIALSRAELESVGEMTHWYAVQRTKKWSDFISTALESMRLRFEEEGEPEIEVQQYVDQDSYTKKTAVTLENALRNMGFSLSSFVDPEAADVGPSVIRFKVSLKTNEKLSAVQARSQDLMRELAVLREPIIDNLPGTRYVYVDVPHPDRQPVSLSNHLQRPPDADDGIKCPFGVTPSGEIISFDLSTLPHMLVAGSTNSGKTTFLYTLITCLATYYDPGSLRMLLIDPKQTDFVYFNDLPHLLQPVITDPEVAIDALQKLLTEEVERRTELLTTARAKDIKSYNRKNGQAPLAPIVVVIDEFADLSDVMSGQDQEAFDHALKRLAQRARSVGIHLVVATQRPSVDVVNGAIKTNLPCRVSFRLASGTDSRTILDQTGAENLLGQGDMLVTWNGDTTRLQGFYISEEALEEMFM